MDAGEDVVCGFGPAEGLGVCIGGLDVNFDGLFKIGDRAEYASLEGTVGQWRKEALDLIDPGGRRPARASAGAWRTSCGSA